MALSNQTAFSLGNNRGALFPLEAEILRWVKGVASPPTLPKLSLGLASRPLFLASTLHELSCCHSCIRYPQYGQNNHRLDYESFASAARVLVWFYTHEQFTKCSELLCRCRKKKVSRDQNLAAMGKSG